MPPQVGGAGGGSRPVDNQQGETGIQKSPELKQPVAPPKAEPQQDTQTAAKKSHAAQKHVSEHKSHHAVQSHITQKNLAKQLDQQQPVKHPMPDIKGQTYVAVPKREGGYMHNTGATKILHSWSQDFPQQQEKIKGKQANVQKATEEFNKTMKTNHEAVMKAAAKDNPKALETLDKKTNGKASEMLQKYNEAGNNVKSAEHRATAAENRIDSAGKKFEIAQDTLKIAALEESKKNAQAELSELQKKVTERGEILDIAIKVAKRDVSGMAEDLAKKVIGGMSRAELEKSAQLDAQISALDEKIGKLEGNKDQAQFVAAKKELEAAREDWIASKMDVHTQKSNQRGYLHQLAGLEKNNGTGTFFQSVDKYANEVSEKTMKLRAANDDYINTLSSGRIADAGKNADAVRSDIRHNEVYGRPDEKWTDAANSSRQYFDGIEKWRQEELSTHRQLQTDSRDNENIFAPQTWAMGEANKALGTPMVVVP